MRIARALALAGITSRRKSEEHIRNGAVTVNGEVVQDLGRQVDPETDAICFRGKMLQFHPHVYFVMNKPAGYVTTASDPHAKKNVYDLLPRQLVNATRQAKADKTRVFPVGRLDRDSCGLLLFTNDGELAYRLMHPSFQVGKWYEVRLDRAFDLRDRAELLNGIRLSDGVARAMKVKVHTRRVLHLLLCEGKNREIRRMMEALGYEVVYLFRYALGPIMLGNLAPGGGRYLAKSEIQELKAFAAGESSRSS